MFLPETLTPVSQIAETIAQLPEKAATQTTAQIGEREGKIRNVVRIEVIKEEQRRIEEEEAETKQEKEASKKEEQLKAAKEKEEGKKKERKTTILRLFSKSLLFWSVIKKP